MKNKFIAMLSLALVLFGCQQAELSAPDEMGAPQMKTVTVSAGMGGAIADTKASLDSSTGKFAWQSGDLISVLATDGKFYDFILKEGAGEWRAEFEGSIPETAQITTVATYPRIAANGTENTLLTGNTLNYVLPQEWNYMKYVSSVPMVATFGEGAEDFTFRQVGGVMRFPIRNLSANSTIVITMADKTITGEFPVDITKLGETAMVAGDAASEVVIKYTSEYPSVRSELNLPVPTGVYNNFKLTIKNAEDTEIYSKEYTSDQNVVNRATLLNMSEIVLPELPYSVTEVWPFFVDARVVLPKYEEIDQVAAYIDGATEPVLCDVEDWGDKSAILIGGDFSHNSTHTVAVAKVVDGEVVAESKSEAVEFTTADMRQLTNNTGTRFVSVGWDDVAIEGGPIWDAINKRYSVVVADDISLRDRVYQVQLMDDAGNILYDMIPFNGHSDFETAFANTTFLAKKEDKWIALPTALTFGWLEPGKDYYFRVKTLRDPVEVDVTNGNYNPVDDNPAKPYPWIMKSVRGGCAWSNPIKVSTDPAHVASENEILYEGFDDMMLTADYLNWSMAVVPDYSETPERISSADYNNNLKKVGHPKSMTNITSPAGHKFTVEGYHNNSGHDAALYGMYDEPYVVNEFRLLNEAAGSLEGWAVATEKSNTVMSPLFGSVRLGRSTWKYAQVGKLMTPPIISDKLHEDVGIKSIVTLQVSFLINGVVDSDKASVVEVRQTRGDMQVSSAQYDIKELYPEEWSASMLGSTTSDYSHYYRYYELKHEVYLRKGDKLTFSKASVGKGALIIGDVKIEVVPGEYENGILNPEDTGVGTEPDDTNYDVYGLGEFPISFWWAPPTSFHNYDDAATRQVYTDMAASGINLLVYNGELDYSVAENKRIMNIAEELGMKFIGQVHADETYPGGFPSNAERIAAIRDNIATSPTYVGEYLADEPSATEFDDLGQFTKDYLAAMPDEEVYINLFPMYAAASKLGTADYEQHINEYLNKVPTKALSYDYYGLHSNGGLNSDYYTNLDLVRSKTLEKRMPFWVITQTGDIGNSTRMPNEKEERWTVWSTIAAGSKGISYFCYWDPRTPNSTEDLSETGMVLRDGTKTDQYYWIQQINEDINTVGKKLLHCHADGAILGSTLYYPLYDNNGAGRTMYGPITNVTASTTHLVGCFRDARRSENGDNYKGYKALVMSQMPNRDITVNMNIDTAVTSIDLTHNNTTSTVQLTNTLNTTVGDITVTFDGARLTLGIPEGEAALLEF